MKAVLFVSDDFLDEASTLAETAGYEIVSILRLPKRPNPRYYIQEDRIAKIKEQNEIDTIIIFDLLKPRHFINLQKDLRDKKILDKLLLLLEIFALHAGSKEAQLQIELAKLKYELPIIKDIYTKFKINEQQGLLGAGVYGVESILRLYHRKIAKISRQLENIKKNREQMLNRSTDIPSIAIAGYTNAGKTSIFNALTSLNQKVDSSMFTTITPKKYKIKVDHLGIMLIDTVGFIRGIPPQIIDAFFVTLSEIKYATGILMIIDISIEDTIIMDMLKSSFDILRELGISGKPIIVVANKSDKLNNKELIDSKLNLIKKISDELYYPIIDVIPTSTLTKYNIDKLKMELKSLINEQKLNFHLNG
ncbi:GTPase HflX [Candidatus Acidianus copahuensis]|uniref:GTPase HflX n=1 Tax=Candidatus Acidianus copahuensis TaxID=1160895 RepID=A0A031LLM6_9CREN|nr:GTPase [Candidatus Acidianus copahuensis]EZQ03031.1 GTPase HflX [Candidatus Acidianus copahuensis]